MWMKFLGMQQSLSCLKIRASFEDSWGQINRDGEET